MGREVTIIEPEHDADDTDGFFPKGPASVCVEGPPQRECYTAPKEFGNSPTVAIVQLRKDMPAILFSAASGGVSGFQIHLALLRPRAGKDLEDFLGPGISVSNQGQYAFWNESAVSDAQIFVTAEYVWGPNESHYGEHRYMISAYISRRVGIDGDLYYLEDRYMTAHKYDLDANADVLVSEKQEILSRLRRLQQETQFKK